MNRSRDEDPQRVSEIWPVALSEALPTLPVPLLPSDPNASLDLNTAIKTIYDRAGYAWWIDYKSPVPPPTLRPEMAAWVTENL